MQRKSRIFSIAVCLLPLLLGVAMYGRLPENLPSHWNFHGEIDGFLPKAWLLFGIPCIMAAAQALVLFCMEKEPRRQAYPKGLRWVLEWLCPCLSLLLVCLSVAAATGIHIDVFAAVQLYCGVLFLVIGVFMPRLKQNTTVGFKIPSTLASEENWEKTHKTAGPVWVLGGILLMMNALSKSVWIMLAVITAMICVPLIVSLAIQKKEKGD